MTKAGASTPGAPASAWFGRKPLAPRTGEHDVAGKTDAPAPFPFAEDLHAPFDPPSSRPGDPRREGDRLYLRVHSRFNGYQKDRVFAFVPISEERRRQWDSNPGRVATPCPPSPPAS